MKIAKWNTNEIVALIQWIPKLTKDTMPSMLRERLLLPSSFLSPIGSDPHALIKFADTESKALEKLLQWSDLIIFDYLTGNYDRAASMLDTADKENRSSVLHENIHNLAIRFGELGNN